jgi:hypothetical protein
MRGEGKNDPRRPLYWILLGFSEDEAFQKSKLERRKCSPRCIEYWLRKGFTEDESLVKIKEIQNNGKSNKGLKRTEEQKQRMKISQSKLQTLDYWIEKYGEELGTEKFLEFKNKKIENGKSSKNIRLSKNPNTYIESSIRRPEYWMKQGYSEEESKLIVSKTQSRGIDFYIKKYGEELGLKKWKDKNDKWFKSFYKSGKNLIEINEKRKLNSHVGYYTEETISDIDFLNFYMIVLEDDGNMMIKYGLTKHDVITKRWSISLKYNLLLFKKMKSIDAVRLENKFHLYFKNSYSPTVIKTTECFEYNDKNLKTSLKILEEFKND